jgi:hypothetical protein
MFGLAQGPTDVPIIFRARDELSQWPPVTEIVSFKEKVNRVLFGWIIENVWSANNDKFSIKLFALSPLGILPPFRYTTAYVSPICTELNDIASGSPVPNLTHIGQM